MEENILRNYKCARCFNYNTSKFSNIRNHVMRKTKCKKISDIILLSNDQLLVLTLIPYHYGKHSIKIEDIEYLSNSNIICNNINELFNEIDKIEKEGIKTCKYCLTEFGLITELRNHVISKCFYEELIRKQIDKQNVHNKTNISDNDLLYINNEKNIKGDNNINGDYNNINLTNNNNNNNNYNLYINMPTPFEEDWDLSEIPESEKESTIISRYVFSRLLKNILKNKKNSNVIIDKDSNSGVVYIDHTNKYIEMKGGDIIEKTMTKLYDQLLDMIDNNNDTLKMVKQVSKEYIHDKYNEYFEIEEAKEVIDENIYDTYYNDINNAKQNYKLVKQCAIKDIHKHINKNTIKEEPLRRYKINEKTRNEQMKSCKFDDYNFYYDSDGNNKL